VSGEDRAEFAERLRLQFTARFRDLRVQADTERFALRLNGPGISDVLLPLTPIYNQCIRHPLSAGASIAEFVRGAETQLTARSPVTMSLARLLWCVRTRDYLDGYSGADELLSRDVAGDLIAFVAESLPNAIMRGVARREWVAVGIAEADVVRAADANTEGRFQGLVRRIATAERVPRDGWKMTGDLFQSSAIVAPGVLRGLVERAGGHVLLGVPDRSVVLARPVGDAEETARFRQLLLRTFRETLNPCSRELLLSDGAGLQVVPRSSRESLGLLDRLRG
jgi:hypothetical protein